MTTGGVGASFARCTLLAVNELQTADELREKRTIHRNAVGWSKAHTERAAMLVAAIESGRLLTPSEARACRDLACEYVQQLLDGPHLAAVWGGEDGGDQHVDAFDDEDDEDDDDYDHEDDMMAPEDSHPPPDEEEEDEDDDNHMTLCCRRRDGRLLNPQVVAWIRQLSVTYNGNAAAVYADLSVAFPSATERQVHEVLSIYGRRATAKGDRVMVPYTEVGTTHCVQMGRGVFDPPCNPPTPSGGL